MKSVRKLPRFLHDLAGELVWLDEKAGAEVAERWYQGLTATIRELRRHPLIGRPRKDLRPPAIRSWRVEGFPRWLIFYSVDEERNVVLYRVRQGTMNLVVLKMDS